MSRSPSGPPPLPEPLPVPVIDNHCHLDLSYGPAVAERLDAAAALERAAAVGVERIVQIGCDLASARWTVAALPGHPRLIAGVSIHPNEAPLLADRGELDAALAEIDALAGTERVRVAGETGLDHARTGEAGRAAQEEAFRAHIEIAQRRGLVLQIHDRDAHAEVLRVLDDAGVPDPTVLHCFSGDAAFAGACLARGCYLSFAGNVTFKSAADLRGALAVTPADRLLVETDAPFLTPVPYRGHRNASYLVPLTVRAMATVRGEPVEQLAAAIAATSRRLYGPW